MKGRYVFLLMMSILSLTGCSDQKVYDADSEEDNVRIMLDTTERDNKKEKTDFSRGDLYTMFEEVNNENVVDFEYGDYNKDGTHEAFVLTNDNGYKLWYMHDQGCELVIEKFTEDEKISVDKVDYSTKSYLFLHRVENGKKNTLVYTIDNADGVLEPNVSGKGYLSEEGKNNLVLRVYSGEEDADGYCDYYLYYNPDEGFKEYGGIPIAEEQFLEFDGAAEILADLHKEYEGYDLDISYLYRSNRYIHLNITYYDGSKLQYKHTTLQYDDTKVTLTGSLIEEGREETAHILGSATFPTAFKHPDEIRKE